ncbi:Ig-like domain-containing protein [Scleromatobacter humisilvae]|uniref:Ig-like domain-containing protein n=1 Tax=Scleromatobacter humisilvae TaxID=2897159 RepID=A0A9X2C238_9BURK|nr:Ig-like domain-containing protein [Scleromatobacter humisilvae]MCK9688862.1 Ig-like domain-containing protein [Scleromatobacter humisilvae]
MHLFPTRWIPTAIAAASLTALTACGGSDSPAAQATASNDAATVPWNTATTLAVTSNDTIANGSASIAVTTAPAHGTAVVSGTGIVYTPAAGYFGADTLQYTLTVGDKTSVAAVALSVAAHMTVKGTVRDAAMPGAQVVLTVGGTALPAVTADADGNYSVDVTTTTPSAFITLKATGVGAQANVVLSSLVGDASATAAVAATDGSVTAAALPAANVTNVTTAEAVLAAQALGKTPASSADIAAAQGQFSSAQTLQMATAIKLVADAGVALPSGAANTLALVADPTAYASFVTTQATTNATVFNATQAAVLADPAIAVAPPAPAAGAADVDMVLTLGQGAGANGVTKMTLKADGTAVVAGAPAQTATWQVNGSEIDVAYDKPITSTTYDIASDGNQWPATETDFGFKVRQLGTGTATQAFVGSTTFTQGPDNGNTKALPETWLTETIVTATQAFHDTDFAVGTEWAGVLTTDFDPGTANYTNQDTLKIVDATHVLYERTGVTGTYAITGGSLVVTLPTGASFSYTRLFTGPKGEERWLTSGLVNGAQTWVYDAAVVKVTPGLSFTTASATNDYLSYINAGLATGQFYIDLLQNGTGAGSSVPGSSALQTPLGTWTVLKDGTESLTRYYCESDSSGVGFCSPGDIAWNVANGYNWGQTRTWTLLATSGNNVYVMERLTNLDGSYDQYRTNVYTKTN